METITTKTHCKKCRWVHQSDGKNGFMGVGLCDLHKSAPELLEACKQAYEYIELILDSSGEDNGEGKILANIEKAINKAEGR